MGRVMEEDEAFNPGQVALFRAISVMLSAQDATGTIEQSFGRHENPLLDVESEMIYAEMVSM
jgi:hypothetical protein